MTYDAFFRHRLDGTRAERRHRVFADSERHCGHFPSAFDHRAVSGGTRDISGNAQLHMQPEAEIAALPQRAATLVYIIPAWEGRYVLAYREPDLSSAR